MTEPVESIPTPVEAPAPPSPARPPARPPRQAAGGAPTPAPPPALSFDELLGQVDRHLKDHPEARETLKRHDIIAGMAGGIAEHLANTRMAAREQVAAAEAASRREQELLKLSEDDPEAFAKLFQGEKQAELARRELESLRFEERRRLAGAIGRAMNDLPEWKTLTPDELRTLARAVSGKPDEEVLSAYHRAAVDLIARKRSEALAAERLQTERQAWESEHAGQRMRSTPAPRLERGEAPRSDSTEPDFNTDPVAFNRWYEQNILRKRRI